MKAGQPTGCEGGYFPATSEHEESLQQTVPNGVLPADRLPLDLLPDFPGNGQDAGAQLLAGHSRSVGRRGGEESQPRYVSELLLAQELGQEDEHQRTRVGPGDFPAVWLPRGHEPYVAGAGEIGHPFEGAPLFPAEDDAEFDAPVQIELEFPKV
jgi:hypothetical protein